MMNVKEEDNIEIVNCIINSLVRLIHKIDKDNQNNIIM